MYQILSCPEISLRRLDGRVAEQLLDLLQLPASRPAHFRAAAPQIVRRNSQNSRSDRISLKQLPDDLLAQGRCLNLSPRG
jgi:hypothetical protein